MIKLNTENKPLLGLERKLPHPLKKIVFNFLKIISFFFYKRKKPDLQKCVNNILIVNLGLIGDVLLITPLIKAIRKSFPESTICVVVPPWSSEILLLNPNIDTLITYKAFWADPEHQHKLLFKHIVATIKMIRKLRKIHFDFVVNTWFADQPLTPLVLRFLRSSFITGFNFPYSMHFNDKSFPYFQNMHVVVNLQKLSEWLVEGSDRYYEKFINLDFYLPENEKMDNHTIDLLAEKKFIVISPFSSEKSKEYSIEKWAIVIDYLKSEFKDIEVVVTGTNKFIEKGDKLERLCNHHILNLVGKQSLYEFAFIVSKSLLVITVDSGTLHIASAFKTPVLVLYSRQYNYKQLLPTGTKYKISVIDVPCAECIYGCDNPICMDHDPIEIIKKIENFIGKET